MSNKIAGSPNIAVLDSRVIADLCIGKFYIDASPSIYIGDGADNVLGARVKVTNPFGVVVKDYASSYEIAPSMPDGMDTVVQFNVPLQASTYQYGKYLIQLKITDSDNKEYVVDQVLDLKCIPTSTNKKYGTIGAELRGSCKDGKVVVLANTPPVYNGKVFESQVAAFNLKYPTAGQLPAINTTASNFSVPLFEGVYEITGETCVTYNLGNNVFVKIKYKLSATKNIRCGINECAVYPRLKSLTDSLDTNCSAEDVNRISSTILESINLMKLIDLGVGCGQDVSKYIESLVQLLNLTDEEITAVTVNGTPSTDLTIEGCGVEKTTVGLTDVYTINNYQWIVEVQENGGVVVASNPVLEGCIQKQKITFNINAAYTQFKNIINNSTEEKLFWTSIVNKGLILGDVNWTLLGLTSSQVNNMTFAQLLNYLLNFAKECCECKAVITDHDVENEGRNVKILWDGTDISAVEIYVDKVLAATVLSPATSYTMLDIADGAEHQYTIIPKSANGKPCIPVAGTFNFFGCAAINPPSVSTNIANNVECPYDLTQLVAPLPLGITAEWHTANNTLASSLVGSPEAVSAGVYFVFAKDANGCYSTGVSVQVTCEAAVSCTAPQNLNVVATPEGFLVSFQSATNNPPVYNVRRRLKADADVIGSYTTIGNPAWNASTSRWEIMDNTAANNTLYVYRAESLCANDAKPFVDFTFANLVCPVITLTPTENQIGYSFPHAGGAVDKYEVSLYNSTGLIREVFDSITPTFTNPVVGTFEELTANTSYKVRLKMFIGTYYKECLFVNTATAPVEICPDVTDIEGEGIGGQNS